MKDTSKVHPLRQERLRQGWTQKQLADFAQVSVSTIERAERWEPLRVDICKRICDALGKKKPEELSLQFYTGPEEKQNNNEASYVYNKEESVPEQVEIVTSNNFFALPLNTVEGTDILDRLIRVVKRPSSIDELVIANLEIATKNHWQLYTGFENSIQYRYDMLDSVSGHLKTITKLLEYPQPSHVHNSLSSLACETTQLIGEIFFDLKDSNTAERYYNTSIEMARETQDNVSLAIALGRKSFIPIYSNNAEKALPLLQEASIHLKDNRSDIIRAWLAAREAEVYANIGEAHACLKLLERAEMYLERAQPEEAPSHAFIGKAVEMHFTRSLLLGYKGACYTRLQLPAEAQKVLKEDITTADPARGIHNAIVLVDLAKTYIQMEEIEEACELASEAIPIMVQLKSARVFQRILDLRRDLELWKNTEYVKSLDRQIATLPFIKVR